MDDIKIEGKKSNLETQMERLMKHTDLEEGDAPKILRLPASECSTIWLRLPRSRWPTFWVEVQELVVPLERNLCGQTLERFRDRIGCRHVALQLIGSTKNRFT